MTDEEASFLRAIRADPDSPAPRLIYADWLDERDDGRAALIRLEERMREVPPYSDEFWRLKPERDRLKALAHGEWLAALGYHLPQPVFRDGWPDDVKGRWRVMRLFAENWYGVVLPDVGGRLEVAAAERRLGRTLPEGLRQLVAFEADMEARRPDWESMSLRVEGEDDAIRLTNMYDQGDCPAVAVADLWQPDPPLGVMFQNGPPSSPEWDWTQHATGDSSYPRGTVSELRLDRLLLASAGEATDRLRSWASGAPWLERAREAFASWHPVGGWSLAEAPGLAAAMTADSLERARLGLMAHVVLFAAAGLERQRIPAFAWEACLGEDVEMEGVFWEERRRQMGDGEG